MKSKYFVYIGGAEEFVSLEWPALRAGRSVCIAEYESGKAWLGVSRNPCVWVQTAMRTARYRSMPDVRHVAVSVPITEDSWREARHAILCVSRGDSIEAHMAAFEQVLNEHT